MTRKISIYAVAMVLCLSFVAMCGAAEKATAGEKAKSFWQKLFNYPANVTKESTATVTDTAKRGSGVVTNQVKTVGQVTSGEFDKTKNLVTDPITGTADTAVKAVEQTAQIPVTAAQDTQ